MPGSTFIEIQEVRAHPDGRLFFCTGVRGLEIVDARDPSAMRVTAELRSSAGARDFPRCQHLAWDGDRLYFTNRGDEIQPQPFVSLYDLSGPAPREVATFLPGAGSVEGIAAAAGRAYVARHRDGLTVLEAEGSDLRPIGQVGGLANAWGVDVAGTTVYVADGPGGLAILDVADPTSPQLLGRAAFGGSAQSVVVSGARAYLAAGSKGLVVVDVADPRAPVVVGSADTPGTALQVAIASGHAFVADWNDVRVFDVSAPGVPRSIASERVETGGPFARVLGVGARDDVAFLGEWTGMYAYRLVPGRRAPDIGLAARDLELGPVAPGATGRATLPIRNDGTAPLVVCEIRAEGPFSAAPASLVLAPGEEANTCRRSTTRTPCVRSWIDCSPKGCRPRCSLNVAGPPFTISPGSIRPKKPSSQPTRSGSAYCARCP